MLFADLLALHLVTFLMLFILVYNSVSLILASLTALFPPYLPLCGVLRGVLVEGCTWWREGLGT